MQHLPRDAKARETQSGVSEKSVALVRRDRREEDGSVKTIQEKLRG